MALEGHICRLSFCCHKSIISGICLSQPPSWESPSTYPLRAMLRCLFFFCIMGLRLVALQGLCGDSSTYSSSLLTLLHSLFHWRSNTSGRASLPWLRPPPPLQHQTEKPNMQVKPWVVEPSSQSSGSRYAESSCFIRVSGPLCFTAVLPEFCWEADRESAVIKPGLKIQCNSWDGRLPKGMGAFI